MFLTRVAKHTTRSNQIRSINEMNHFPQAAAVDCHLLARVAVVPFEDLIYHLPSVVVVVVIAFNGEPSSTRTSARHYCSCCGCRFKIRNSFTKSYLFPRAVHATTRQPRGRDSCCFSRFYALLLIHGWSRGTRPKGGKTHSHHVYHHLIMILANKQAPRGGVKGTI